MCVRVVCVYVHTDTTPFAFTLPLQYPWFEIMQGIAKLMEHTKGKIMFINPGTLRLPLPPAPYVFVR
jgi:hypothetical protein